MEFYSILYNQADDRPDLCSFGMSLAGEDTQNEDSSLVGIYE